MPRERDTLIDETLRELRALAGLDLEASRRLFHDLDALSDAELFELHAELIGPPTPPIRRLTPAPFWVRRLAPARRGA